MKAEFMEKIYARLKLKKAKKKIILPEGEEKRVLEALKTIIELDICIPTIIGNPDKIAKLAREVGVDIKGIEIIDSRNYRNIDKYVELYCEIRKHKNIKKDEARKLLIENPTFYAALAVRNGDYDSFVSGAATTTRDVAKAAIYCIGPSIDITTISSSIIIILPDKKFGANGVFIYADAGIVPNPTKEQLCDITIASVRMARVLLGEEPRVAMLSYSTKGSGGTGESVEKVREATRLASEKEPDLIIDGEVQLDCAVVPEVAKIKDPKSKIQGRANILIFPNLDAGNIAYKLTERFANGRAIGPILQGIKKPVSDLSRGCGTRDIVDAVAVVSLLAGNIAK